MENKDKLILTKGKRPSGRPRWRWEGNMRKYLKVTGTNTRNCVDLAQDKD